MSSVFAFNGHLHCVANQPGLISDFGCAQDKYGNATGTNISGKVSVALGGEGEREVPMLVGNKSTTDFYMNKGVVTIQVNYCSVDKMQQI